MKPVWTAAAEELAEEAASLGSEAAGLNAAAWSARVDPEAIRPLTRAALTLNPDSAGAIWARAAPASGRAELLGAAEEQVAAVRVLGRRAARLAADCQEALAAAISAATAAGQAAAQAAARGDHAAARAAAAADAARAVIADCQAALDILAGLLARLQAAWTALMLLPDEYAATYEVPLAFTAAGGTLPRSGDFLATEGAA